MSSILLIWIWIIVEVALIRDAAGGLLCAPHLLLSSGVGEGLWEGGGSGGKGPTLLSRKVCWSVIETEVQLQAIRIAVIGLLLLLVLVLRVVRHDGQMNLRVYQCQ